MSASPNAATVLLIVCHSQPSPPAISLTVRPKRPTCSVTHRPALSVITSRDAAIAGASSVHDRVAHADRRHCHRTLRHTSREGRPKHARSTSSTTARSLTVAGCSQPGHAGRSARVST